MITFDKESKVFCLNTKSTTYAMGLWNDEKLFHLYWGKRLKNPLGKVDLSNYLSRAHVGYDIEEKYPSDMLPFEYSTYGAADMRLPSVGFTFADGSRVSKLSYNGYEIVNGKPPIDGLPSTYAENSDNVMTLKIKLTDKFQNVDVILSYSVFEDFDAITRNVRIVNNGKKLLLDSVMSSTVDFYGMCDCELLHLDGAWIRERYITRRPIVSGNQSVDSRYGCSSAAHNPFIALCEKGTTESRGNVYGFSLVYSGNFTAGAEKNPYNCVRAYIGINPSNFQFVLENGDSFQSPETVLVYSADGIGGMSRIYHKLYRTRLCRGKYRDSERFVLINNWEATYFDFNEEKIVAIAEKAHEIGVDTMVLDDGWFSSRITDSSNGLGDWYENRDKLPNGLEGLAEKINALGMKLGLWFEPEMVNPGTELYKKHPDWIIHTAGRTPTTSRYQYTLDLSRQDVCDYITEALTSVLKRVNIEYVKWDMNRCMSEPGSAYWTGEHQGEVMHRYILGLYKILETLTERFPNVLFESCAGGGERFDPGMLYYSPQIWTSDDTDAVERLKIQYGTSVVYPFSTMGAHVSAVPNHQMGGITSFDMRCKVAAVGQFGFELDLNKCTEKELETAKSAIESYRKYREIFHKGDCYRLRSPFESGLSAIEFISEDKNTVILTVNCSCPTPNAPDEYIRLDGLDESAIYTDTATGKQYGGDLLMNLGWHFANDTYNQSVITVFVKQLFKND